jgi:hypothetical protein
VTAAGGAGEVLRRHADRAGRALAALAGNRSVCAIGRSGRSFPAAKYHEGAVSAVAEVRRELRRRVRLGERPEVAPVVRAVADAWRVRAAAPAASGADWRAYLAGGVEALEAVLAELHRPDDQVVGEIPQGVY